MATPYQLSPGHDGALRHRFRYADATIKILDPIFMTRTRADWIERLRAADVIVCPVNNRLEAAGDQQAKINGYITELKYKWHGSIPDQTVDCMGMTVEFSATPGRGPTTRQPDLGEHTSEILQGVGYNWNDRRKRSMRKLKLSLRWVIILVFLSGLCLAAASGLAAPPKILSVQVRETQMRATPSFLGKITGKLAYGDAVNLLDEGRDWKKVAPAKGRAQGWVHTSALTTKKIVMKAGKGTVQTGASGGEIALAGKGFSDEVEKEFRKKNRNLDFAWVDRMEAFRITPAEIEVFLRQGKVTPSEGGAP